MRDEFDKKLKKKEIKMRDKFDKKLNVLFDNPNPHVSHSGTDSPTKSIEFSRKSIFHYGSWV